jgi:GNAT superfamily N-acetyltransferase
MALDRYRIARDTEAAAWVELFGSAPAPLARRLGMTVTRMSGAVALAAPAIEHPMLNRAFVSDSDQRTLEAVVAHYRGAGVERYLVHRRRESVSEPGAGLTRYRRAWVKLMGPARRVPMPALDSLTIEPVGPGSAPACAELFCRGFDIPEAAAGLFAAATEHRRWHLLRVIDDAGVLAGVGYLYVRGQVGYLAGGVTDPRYRRRGVQSALLAARINTAADLGCRWVVSETGEDAPGDPQHSLHNMQRLGLEVVGVTENLVATEMQWNHGAGRVVGAAIS